MRTAVMLTAAVLCTTLNVFAQQHPSVHVGQRIRVSYDCITSAPYGGRARERCQSHTGALIALSADSFIVAGKSGAERLAIPKVNVARIDTSHGFKANRLRGGGIGALVGAAVGAFAISTHWETGADFGTTWTLAGAAIVSPIGFVTGLIVGTIIVTEKWEEVPLGHRRIQIIDMRQSSAGWTLGLSVSF